jgi:hypothetical protein
MCDRPPAHCCLHHLINQSTNQSLQAASALAVRRADDQEYAVRGGIADLEGSWGALRPRLAMTYPFELDVFQKEAILHLEAGNSVRGCLWDVVVDVVVDVTFQTFWMHSDASKHLRQSCCSCCCCFCFK